MVEQRATEVTALRDRAGRCLDHRLGAADDDLRHTLARLRALSPAATLERGYAIVQRADGHVVRAAGRGRQGRPAAGTAGRGRAGRTVDG